MGAEPVIYLTTKQVAGLLQIAPQTLKKARVTGKGPPFIKLGASVRYRRSDIDDYVTQRRCHSTTAAEQLAVIHQQSKRLGPTA